MLFINKRSKVTSDKITIPARASSPETKLFVKIISQEKDKTESRPTIFILPGGPGIDHTAYSKYSCLIDVADIVFHDPRGCGRSAKDHPSTYSMDNYIDDVEALRNALNLEKIIVLGKSYGSVCSMGYALRYGHTIEKLILSAGAPSFRSIETAKKTS
jgi:proline iminopeptidase